MPHTTHATKTSHMPQKSCITYATLKMHHTCQKLTSHMPHLRCITHARNLHHICHTKDASSHARNLHHICLTKDASSHARNLHHICHTKDASSHARNLHHICHTKDASSYARNLHHICHTKDASHMPETYITYATKHTTIMHHNKPLKCMNGSCPHLVLKLLQGKSLHNIKNKGTFSRWSRSH